MPYTPNQDRIYTAAFVGSITGMGLSAIVATAPNNIGYAAVAGAFAQQFDTLWGPTTPTALDVGLVEQMAMQLWNQNPPTVSTITSTPANYIAKCIAMIELISVAHSYYVSQSVTPPDIGGGGSGSVGPAGPAGPAGAAGADGADGVGLVTVFEIPLATGVFSTQSTVYTRVGARVIDLSDYPVSNGDIAKPRIIQLVYNAEKTGGATRTDIRVIDITHDSVVIAGSELSTLSTANEQLVSAPLIAGNTNGSIRSDTPSLYAVQIKRVGGSPTDDAAILTNARLEISYAP